jgi:hypothetical protein
MWWLKAFAPVLGEEPLRLGWLIERATGFEPATFSLATLPWVMRRAISHFVRMPLNGLLEAI